MKLAPLALTMALAAPALAFAAEPRNPGDVCLDAGHIDHTVVVDDRTILFYMRGGKVWQNTLREACPSLKFERAFSEEIRGDVVCSNRQIIRVLHTGAACSLGAFTPYIPPAKAAP
jgi:hypothetical protein